MDIKKRQEAKKKFNNNIKKEIKKNIERERQSIEYAKHTIKR